MLVKQGFYPSRNKALAAILAGDVKVNGESVNKPDLLVGETNRLEVTDRSARYVSRGGWKLEAALDFFKLDVRGRVALDGGSSTGGFTDCLLRRGAAKVIAVDVGYGQLAWKLRQDLRVEVHERVNLRYLKPGDISEKASIAVIDVSFISVLKVIPAAAECLKAEGDLLVLIKPHFEVGKGEVGKGGVVRKAEKHRGVLKTVINQLKESGFGIKGLTYSPILGAKGNIEFWLSLQKNGGLSRKDIDRAVDSVVAEAHERLERAG